MRKSDVRIVTVPGALEIPLALQKLALTGRFDALIALGAVIRGETYHFEIVANESASGITTVALDTGVPIANGILTTNDEDEALARMAQKGQDCAAAAIEMATISGPCGLALVSLMAAPALAEGLRVFGLRGCAACIGRK